MFKNDHKQQAKPVTDKGPAFFQPKLTVNQPGDIYEQEADAMADKVMTMRGGDAGGSFFNPSALNMQRKCQHCEEEEKAQRKEDANNQSEVTGKNESYMGSLGGKGTPLSQNERSFFEPRIGYDLSHVRIHTGADAEKSSKDVNALAYTHGSNIVFGANQYQPGTDNGKRLMAHELTHTLQQKGGVGLKRVQRIPAQQPSPAPTPVNSESNQSVSETISNAPAGSESWNSSFTWDSKFQVVYDPGAKTATIVSRLYSTADAAAKQGWEDAIENRWGKGNFSLEVWEGCSPKVVPIYVDVIWVDDPSKAHYTIQANQADATLDGRAGLGGTTGMTSWGVADRTDITHEYGHMLGNPEEYFTTNGVDYTYGGTKHGARDTGAGIMNNPSESPEPRHYELVKTAFINMMHFPPSMTRVVKYGSSNPPLRVCGDFATPANNGTAVA